MLQPPLKIRPKPDALLRRIADYVVRDQANSGEAMTMARYCLMDALGCGMQAFAAPECVMHIGPIVPGTIVPNGARVPGTQLQLDPVKAAFDITCLIRWFDFNAVWYTGGSPADSLGAVLAAADYVSRGSVARGRAPVLMREVLGFLIKAYEIHGLLSSGNKMDQPAIGLDSTFFVKIASTAVATRIVGGTMGEIVNALSHAIVDGHSLNLYRVWPHTGPRKSWAAADAASRGVRLALFAVAGEMGYLSALSAKTWGFHDVLFKGKPLTIPSAFGSQVVKNIQFKIAFPAQRHCQSAAECAVRLHPEINYRLDDIDRVVITTHELAMRTVNVSGLLANYAARDHCMQYVVSVALIHGIVTAASYGDEFAADLRIDALRARMVVVEDERYTRGHHDPRTRSNANALQVFFKDGSSTRKVAVEYPVGDSHRRAEGLPRLEAKFKANLACRYALRQQHQIFALLSDQRRLEATPVNELMDMLAA